MRRYGSLFVMPVLSACVLSACVLSACAPSSPPCTAGSVCGLESTCLAGTCPPVTALPSRATSRVVSRPLALAWVRRGSNERESIATLGGARDTKLLLRFSVPVEDADRLVSAHVILTRVFRDPPLSQLSQGEGGGAILRGERIVDGWDPLQVTWANQPRTFDVGLPRVRAYGSRLERLRIDVTDIVRRWPRRDPSDQGIAIVGDGTPSVDVALATLAPEHVLGARPVSPPELELYLAR